MANTSAFRHAAGAPKAPGGSRRLRIAVRGAVQGVGFRPFVYRLAQELGLSGWVVNDTRGVDLEIQGDPGEMERFRTRLVEEAPPLAVIHRVDSRPVAPGSSAADGFEIRRSASEGARTAVVLPDAATCPACLAEVLDPEERRYRYPFTNCTHCGPRFTIVRSLPYDRPNTTMSGFEICPDCRREYEDPLDRRFHAQPVACPSCGPALALRDSRGTTLPGDPLGEAAEALRRGRIVGLKGLGGYQLLTDARSEAAVGRLRKRKHREEKPFALMVRDLTAVRKLCRVSPGEEKLLSSVRAPIVLLERLPEAPVAPTVAPDNRYLGVMLPTTPLHHLLLEDLDFPVVATSGNRCDEPIATTEEAAVERLGEIADLLLTHDRPIQRHVDDSVARVVLGGGQILRRARGWAPMPVVRSRRGPTVLAVGAHLKNTIALSVRSNVYLSQHLGDMETPETLEAFERVIDDFFRLYEARPVAVAHDLHPDYASTRYARELAERLESGGGPPVPLVAVQHHHAHLAACLEDSGEEGRALGVTWDGTGYGTDGTVWGGELLLGDAASYRRVGRLRPFRLPGGEMAVREPRRTALALLWELLGPAALERDDLAPVASFAPAERRVLAGMLEGGLNAPVTTSAGRLFDGVAALLDLRQTVSFEGQAAMALEQTAEESSGGVEDGYLLAVNGDLTRGLELDWRPLLEEVLAELARGVPKFRIAQRFHAGLARAIADAASAVGEPRVALTGGCFQNRLLTEQSAELLSRAGHRVLVHRSVPPNDGGIALGQVAVATARIQRKET
ncbi:MAG: carbamoyltransferase HypF, partial [Thermoanaerobaculia bacterium]|nr:carbamoyltransferase HypF [Thermoanaerobaculia bacterium]